MRPVVLTIAGSDSSAGAGIQGDLKTIEAGGAYAATAITAVTAQNTLGVKSSRILDADIVRDQIEAVLQDLPVRAVKTGMLGNDEIVRVVADCLRRFAPAHYVCDPVMVSGAGFPLLSPRGRLALKSELLPLATLITPNVAEAEELSGRPVADVESAAEAGRVLLDAGCGAVLVTGGHLRSGRATDVLVSAEGRTTFPAAPLDAPHDHGTGCVLSAAVAARLARGLPLIEAVAAAKRFVTRAIRHGLPLGSGTGPTDPLHALHEPAPGGGDPEP